VFESVSGQCFVQDPAEACQAAGGIYDPATDNCSFGVDDSDHDGWPDSLDNCPSIANTDQSDADLDGAGDACDSGGGGGSGDADSAGIPNNLDLCPDPAPGTSDGCPVPTEAPTAVPDADGDGIPMTWTSVPSTCPGTIDGCPVPPR
jgi:hypothetical protein